MFLGSTYIPHKAVLFIFPHSDVLKTLAQVNGMLSLAAIGPGPSSVGQRPFIVGP